MDETAPKFAVGDIVVLVSGGPPMTVAGFWGDGTAMCHWFDHGELKEASFRPESLTLAELSE